MELYADGVVVALDAPELPPRSVDAPDVSALPGARIVASAGWEDASTVVRAGCVRGPSDRFIQGLEGVLFDKATWFMLRAVDARTTELATTATAGQIQSGLVEETRLGKLDTGATLAMHNLLTFAGEDGDVLLCSAVCTTTADVASPATSPALSCATIAGSLHVEGAHAPLPDPSLWMRAFIYGVEQPLVGGAVVGTLFVLVAVVLIRRRPRARR